MAGQRVRKHRGMRRDISPVFYLVRETENIYYIYAHARTHTYIYVYVTNIWQSHKEPYLTWLSRASSTAGLSLEPQMRCPYVMFKFLIAILIKVKRQNKIFNPI